MKAKNGLMKVRTDGWMNQMMGGKNKRTDKTTNDNERMDERNTLGEMRPTLHASQTEGRCDRFPDQLPAVIGGRADQIRQRLLTSSLDTSRYAESVLMPKRTLCWVVLQEMQAQACTKGNLVVMQTM